MTQKIRPEITNEVNGKATGIRRIAKKNPKVGSVAAIDLTYSQQLGTPRNCWGNSISERDWAIIQALDGHRTRFGARKDRQDLTIGQRTYAAQRYRSCGTEHSQRVESCGLGTIWFIKCGCSAGQVESRCNVKASCEKCATRIRAGYARKMELGLEAALEELRESKRGRGRALIRMITLTVRHSGDVATDRASIVRAWRLWRRWLADELGYSPEYAGAWEMTAGKDGLGHIHLHICLVTTNFDYRVAREVWQCAIGDSDAQWDVSVSSNPRKSCQYVAKYIGKTAYNLPVELEAAWIGAQYGKRTVTASRGLLKKRPCEKCRQHWGVDYRHLEFLQVPIDMEAARIRLEVALSVGDAWEYRMCEFDKPH